MKEMCVPVQDHPGLCECFVHAFEHSPIVGTGCLVVFSYRFEKIKPPEFINTET